LLKSIGKKEGETTGHTMKLRKKNFLNQEKEQINNEPSEKIKVSLK